MEGEATVGRSVTPSPRGSGLAAAGWAVTAIVALLVLVDIAIETFWSGSPIRWWVAPPAIVFVALSIWLWMPGGPAAKRWGWEGAASWSVGGVVLILAVTAWLAEGQTNGVRMLLQPTATVLTLATAAAVVLAAFVLFRALAVLPSTARVAARGVVLALAIYALASLGLALYERASFAALFQGGAAWQRLPRWLQGAFVGAFALLPLSLLGLVIRAIDYLRRKQPVHILLHQATALVMAIVMATSGVFVPGNETTSSAAVGTAIAARPTGAAPREIGPPTAAEFEQSGKALFGQKDPAAVGEEFVRAAEQELSRPGADPSDINAKAMALGRDAGTIFEFVRDKVAIEPYVGVLRGARGTLSAGAGNALDRALLAQALLEAIGVESRLISGKLSANQADVLLARFFEADATQGLGVGISRKAQDPSPEAAAREVAGKAGASPDAAAELLLRAQQRSDAFWWKADEQRAASLEFLAGQLRKGGVKVSDDGQAVITMLRDRLREHYWLQTKDASGAWVEFDPSFPDARPGVAVASNPLVMTEVPADRYHRFELQLVYRTRSGGSPKQEVLLKRGVVSADALFVPLELRIQPAEAVPDVNALRTMDGRQRAEMLRKLKRFQVLLRAGTAVTAGREFDLEGHIYDAKTSDPMGGTGGLMGGMLGFGGEEDSPAFLDLQVVLRLSGPGRAPLKQTRTLVRAADTASPTFAPPIGEWQLLVQPQWVSADLAGFQMLSHLTSITKGMTTALKNKTGLAGVSLPPPVSPQLLQLALLRQSAAEKILAGQPGLRAFVDSPMITIAGHRLSELRPDEGRIVAERSIDIVENAARFAAKDPRSTSAWEAALAQGVADCTLERFLLQEMFPDSKATSGSTIFERARLEGRQPLLTVARDAAALKVAGLAAADVEWIGANESPQARLLVAKAAQGPAAWWSVQPNGSAVLRVSGGQGQALSEHGMQIVLKILGFLVCVVEGVGAVQHYEEAVAKVTLVWCATATITSGGMAALHAITASWVFLAVEAAVLVGTQAYETYGHE